MQSEIELGKDLKGERALEEKAWGYHCFPFLLFMQVDECLREGFVVDKWWRVMLFFLQLLRGVILVDERVRNEPLGPTLDFGNMLFLETRRCAWAGGWQPLLLYLCTPSIIIFYFPKFHEGTKFPSLYLNLIIFKSKKNY
jgi:hypothetical protein